MCVCDNGVIRDSLTDSRCTRSFVKSSVCGPPNGRKTEVLTIDGKNMTSTGATKVNLQVHKRISVAMKMLAMDGDLLGLDPLLGLYVIELLGCVHINEHSEGNFMNKVTNVCAAVTVKIE